MRKLLAGSVLLWLLAIPAWAALTLAQTEALVDSLIDGGQATITANINACLATAEGCNTGWSCSTANQCNILASDSALCYSTQDDPGTPQATMNADGATCTVSAKAGTTFVSHGFPLPGTSQACYQANTYDGGHNDPSKRGVQLCYRIRYSGTIYQKCRGYGPQAAAFNVDWAAAQ